MKTELFFRQPESVRDVEVRLIKSRRCGSPFQQLVVIQSRKNGNCLRMSPTLLDFCLMLERRRDIRYYQPTPYTLIQPSRAFRYTPAVCAYGDDLGLVFFETSRFMSDGYEDQLVRHEDWFGEMGYLFCACQPCANISYCELLQWRYLYSYSFSFKAQGSSLALDILKHHNDCTIQELLDAGADFSDIAYQLFYGGATADLRLPITRTSAIALPSARS
ncbi:hypothetical protein [Pseudomonas umsongensis]|uniref:hypothetical protein n=1 Tax=Pseudomonas umsongensis TaxID=198618 RepID=UPI00200A62CA|nr:hypothetical protein [Pseudomonas umsongensis]MCK8683259.1 hypothetical protein [Pseudomonas umsongensis]